MDSNRRRAVRISLTIFATVLAGATMHPLGAQAPAQSLSPTSRQISILLAVGRSLSDSIGPAVQLDFHAWQPRANLQMVKGHLADSTQLEAAERKEAIKSSGLRVVDAFALAPCPGIFAGTSAAVLRQVCPMQREYVAIVSLPVITSPPDAAHELVSVYVVVETRTPGGISQTTYRYRLLRKADASWLVVERLALSTSD